MTLGQRIQAFRKQKGLSQESLGDALGVSRQAVSKWEGDNGIPELDTIIAMSRLFDITVGQLLGIETPFEQESRPVDHVDTHEMESILCHYAEEAAAAKKSGHSWLSRWGDLSLAIIVTTVFVVMFAQLFSLRSTVKLLQRDISSLQVNISNIQNNIPGQVRNTIYDVLAEKATLLSTFRWEVVEFDPDEQTATLRLDATLKEYTAGSKMQFCTTWSKPDGTEGQTNGTWVEGPNFRSEIALPLNHRTTIRIRIEDTKGNILEQPIEAPIHELHPDNFYLEAYHLRAPFAIEVNGATPSKPIEKAEWAPIEIMSIFPDFVWPETAVLTAHKNDAEIMRESMNIAPSGKEDQVFHASIRDGYYDLSMKEGDVLNIVLMVTDNLGRTQQFIEWVSIENGKLDYSESTAPVISIDS